MKEFCDCIINFIRWALKFLGVDKAPAIFRWFLALLIVSFPFFVAFLVFLAKTTPWVLFL